MTDKQLAVMFDSIAQNMNILLDIQKIALKNENRIIEIMAEQVCFTTMVADRLLELLGEQKPEEEWQDISSTLLQSFY